MKLPELLDNMAGCTGVIGVDTGLSHMAVALDLKHVQIFSHPRAFRAGPLPSDHQLSAGGEGAPGVDEVWQAWQRVAAAGASR
jgi:heptosyltransferase-1